MSTVESIARPRRNGERRRSLTASISKESLAFFPTRRSSDLLSFPICSRGSEALLRVTTSRIRPVTGWALDRKSTRLNSSHVAISYADLCFKKKKSTVHHKRDDEGHKK